MASKQRRLSTWQGALIALSVTFTACGSGVPPRPAALDPSNPDGPESPRIAMNRDAALTPTAAETRADGVPSSDGGSAPMHHDHQPRHQSGTGTEPMDMSDAGAPSAAPSADAATVYTCPMHPEVTSNQPGQCPKCGMKLLPKAKAAPNAPVGAHVHGTSGGTTPAPAKGSK